VRGLIYRRAGISLADSKQEMVYSRLARRLRATGIASFAAYLDDLEAGRRPDEWESFVNALTTNLTSFFREAHHFPLLADHAQGCASARHAADDLVLGRSTGEEPYSIAMTLCEAFNTLTPPVTSSPPTSTRACWPRPAPACILRTGSTRWKPNA
jgi:chemotaxis protein methyltransferase CheR